MVHVAQIMARRVHIVCAPAGRVSTPGAEPTE